MNKTEQGYSSVVVGLQYGDEGKGKESDILANEFDIDARFNGGRNAGHTITVDGKEIVLHMIPSGAVRPNMQLYIGSGCMLSSIELVEEVQALEDVGINLYGRFHISDKAGVIMPHEKLFDEITGREIGTTGNGIGPAYADRAFRRVGKLLKHLRIGDVMADRDKAREVMLSNLYDFIHTNEHLLGPEEALALSRKAEDIVEESLHAIDTIVTRGFVECDPLFLEKQVRGGKKVLFEMGQGTGLDVNHGTYPSVTSSHALAGSAYTGGDLPPKYHRATYGVAKAIMSRVGNGPFVSELGGARSEQYCDKKIPGTPMKALYSREYEKDHYQIEELLQSDDEFLIGIAIRMLSGEYGATTGRPRRMGALDLVQLRQHCCLNGVDEMFLNKVDHLTIFTRTNLRGIPLVTGYELDGRPIDYVPTSETALRRVKPLVEYASKFPLDMKPTNRLSDLPREVHEYCERIQDAVGCCLRGIGLGPGRSQMVRL